MIAYRDDADGVRPEQLTGFFVGWPNPPSPECHLRLLANSDRVALAWDTEADRAVGFATALTDGVLTGSIPLLEVLPAYQCRGIGRELVGRVLGQLGDLYAVDLVCDEPLTPFYRSMGFDRGIAMSIRNYGQQSGVN